MHPDGLRWPNIPSREGGQDLNRRSQVGPGRRVGGHSVLLCIAIQYQPFLAGQVEPRLLFSFEEGVCGEVVGDDVGEGRAPVP